MYILSLTHTHTFTYISTAYEGLLIHHVGAGIWTQDLWMRIPVILTSKPSLKHMGFYVFIIVELDQRDGVVHKALAI